MFIKKRGDTTLNYIDYKMKAMRDENNDDIEKTDIS